MQRPQVGDDQWRDPREKPDRTLASDAARGDEYAFSLLWRRHEGRLRRRITGRLAVHVRRQWPVADILQEVSIALWNCLRTSWLLAPRTEHSFRNLVNGICRFKELDALREYYRPRAWATLPANVQAQSVPPAQRTIWEELKVYIALLIKRLPEKERCTYVLVVEQDLSCFRASKLLGVDVRTVQRRLKAAKQRLIRWLGEEY